MTKVPEFKKKIVEDIVKLIRQYPIIGMVNMENIPAPQLQSMKAELRGKVQLFMTKKRLIRIAIEKTKNEKKNIEELEKYFEGMPALIFTNESPFKLSRILQKSKTSAPAKAGQIAPNDITIAKGPTPFAPGPVISELSSVGLKVGVENGKVAVKEDAVIAKKGEKIKPKVAEILTRLNIKPMQVGLGLIAAYEGGVIYQRDVLEVDEKAFYEKLNLAAVQAFNLAFNIAYPTKDNINFLIAKAFNDAKAIGVSQKIFDKGIIETLLSKAEMEMLGLKDTANIEIKALETKEEKTPELKQEAKQEQPKPEVKKEEPKKEVKPEDEVKKEEQIEKEPQKPAETPEQKEEKALEEEKEILKEEKKLEEKSEQVQAPGETEVKEAVKEEEEKQLEKERIEKEKEVEKAEEQRSKEVKKEDKVDKKVEKMVENTKKFAEGREETAADIIEAVKKEEKKDEEREAKKKEKPQVPSTHDLKKQKEGKEQEQDKQIEEVEGLTKELLRKGTLRKK